MSRIYDNLNIAVNEIERDLHEMGTLVRTMSMQNKLIEEDDDTYDTLELQNYSFTILNLKNIDKEIEPKVLKWCESEFKERISDNFTNPGEAWKLREEVWKEFLTDEKFCYTYNERINNFDQLNKIIDELTENPNTRQAVLDIHSASDNNKLRKSRIPCSLSYQFLIRNKKLNIIYNMRSSDFYTHFKNDIWLANKMLTYIAGILKIPVWSLHMNIGSLHIYKKYQSEKNVF